MFAADPQYVREVIHAFNDQRFAALNPKWSGGRRPKFAPTPANSSAGPRRPPRSSYGCRSPRGAWPSSPATSTSTTGSTSPRRRCG
ncbi:hypothetical protein ACQPZQ_15275 [Pseudonocardia sp. CA-142604]|uniref:hypothetical protein n=1 Tax=Pseudonocardia sp. CA-142604 TaxID=3240024 RepID=UPI003D89D209